MTDEATDDVVKTIVAYSNAYDLGEAPFSIGKVEDFYSKTNGLTIAIPGFPSVMFQNWESYASSWSEALANFRSFRFGVNGDLVVRRLGAVAWASQTGYSFGTRIDGTDFRRELRQTLVLALERDSSWRIVQEHVSLGA